MRTRFLPFSPPSIGEDEIAEVVDTLRSGWITTGPKVARFENDFAEFAQVPEAVALSSATAALHVAFCSLGIGPGDQVICTPMTFCSSIHVIEHVGARPLLVDVERDTLNIDPEQVEAAVKNNPAVKAIEPVHLHGHPCSMRSLWDIARRYRLPLVEDAAHALPARYGGRLVGSPPPAGVVSMTAFSFYATKNLTTAEGGMLTGPPELLDKARILGLHGMSRDAYDRYTEAGSWHYDVVNAGFKYNMTDIQAALGIHQLKRLPAMQQRRQQIADRYNSAFGGMAAIEPPTVRLDVDHARHIYGIRLRLEELTIDRSGFIEELKALSIGTSVHFIPVHLHAYYRDRYGYRPDAFPIANEEYKRMLSLPLYPHMTDEDVDDVIDAVGLVVERYQR